MYFHISNSNNLLLVSFSTTLKEFILNKPEKYITKNSLRSLSTILREYRSLEILQKQFLELYGFIFIPFQFLVGNAILYIIYTLLKHGPVLPGSTKLLLILCGINLAIIWPVVLESCGKLHQQGSAIIRSWRYMNCGRHRKYFSKFRKRCKPFSVGTQGLFTIKRLTVLKFLKGITRGTFRMLLTL